MEYRGRFSFAILASRDCRVASRAGNRRVSLAPPRPAAFTGSRLVRRRSPSPSDPAGSHRVSPSSSDPAGSCRVSPGSQAFAVTVRPAGSCRVSQDSFRFAGAFLVLDVAYMETPGYVAFDKLHFIHYIASSRLQTKVRLPCAQYVSASGICSGAEISRIAKEQVKSSFSPKSQGREDAAQSIGRASGRSL